MLLTQVAIAKVSDSGLSKVQAAHWDITANRLDASILVSTGGMTSAYCPREQATGQPLWRKTDLWSWEVSLLEMVTGEMPLGHFEPLSR